ncbi:MAG: EAL domain-containing protein, partial [Burkholderiaceae bacterium]
MKSYVESLDACAPSIPAPGCETPPFSYAFQPIVDVVAREIYSFEALIRGPGNEPAYQVLRCVPPQLKYQFDRDSRVAAIALGARLGLDRNLNLNFLPQGLDNSTDAIKSTIEAAVENHIRLDRLIVEITEGEMIHDPGRFVALVNEYRAMGIQVAIDDFGA